MNIGILGYGTIGSGVVKAIDALRGAGRKDFFVRAILDKPERAHLDARIVTDISRIALDPEIDAVVEVMGGVHPAFEFASACLEAGKHFVTANKFLVTQCGAELESIAQAHNCAFLFGAACGGGIPYLRTLNHLSLSDELLEVGGILNGTTNYILDAMQRREKTYAEALQSAKELGYAEADPTNDVCGYDTRCKIILSGACAFSKLADVDSVAVEGISTVRVSDIRYLQKRKLTLRLIAHAGRTADGLFSYVEPAAFSSTAPECAITDNLNIAWLKSAFSGKLCFTGQGAGQMPTAGNILMDLSDILAGKRRMYPADCASVPADNASAIHPYYLRLRQSALSAWVRQKAVHCEPDGEDYALQLTPVSVCEMHKNIAVLRKNDPGLFFAGIHG